MMNTSQSHTVRTMRPMSCYLTLCGMLAEVEDGQLLRVTGDKDNPDARGFYACVGRHRLK